MIEEECKNKYKFIKFLLVIFICFIIMYISKENGYYEYRTYNKTRLTEDAIKRFESDINEGKNVLLKDYIVEEKHDYSNKVSKVGSSIGKFIESIMNDGIKNTLKYLSALFYE